MKGIFSKVAAIAAIGVIGTAVAGTASAAAPAAKATGSVTWNYQGKVTGSVVFDANNKTGGTLDYQASNGMWLHGVVTPGSVVKDGNTAVFAGAITDGSSDYLANPLGANYFTVKVVDGGTSGRNGDMIAVLANQDGEGHWLETSSNAGTTANYLMTPATAGIVTSGNLTVH